MDILVIHSLYIPYIFPRYVPLSSMYFPLCVSSFMESREDNLEYIVEYSEDEFFNDLRENPTNFEYLEKIFDSKDLDFKNEFRIYKINIRD